MQLRKLSYSLPLVASLLLMMRGLGLHMGSRQWQRIPQNISYGFLMLSIPSGVKHIGLAFDVRANSWDIWGGDQLQVDLIDPMTNQSILVTPVQWTNLQLASGGWMPLQVDIQDWPGIDTPLQLVFRAQTDWAFPTDFTVDNIRFLTVCASIRT